MSKGSWRPLGFDLETSAIDPTEGVILSVGAYDPETQREFYEEVRWDNLQLNPSAMRINQIPCTSIDSPLNSLGAQRLRNDVCDIAFSTWLKDHGYDNCEYIPVGMNVGSFDIQWLARHMPKSRAQFGHRFIDINSLIYRESYRRDFGYSGLITLVRKTATQRLDETAALRNKAAELNKHEDHNFAQHNALYDAMLAWESFDILCHLDQLPGVPAVKI